MVNPSTPALWLLCASALVKAHAVAPAAMNKHDWMERMRYQVRHQADENRARITALLPDAPFIQLRNGVENNGRSLSVNGTKNSPKIVQLRRGQTAVLQCEVLGMPSPVAYWTKNGQPVAERETASEATTASQSSNLVEMLMNRDRPTLENAVTVAKLKFNCVNPSHAGVYQCNGDNGVEKVVAYTKVVVDAEAEDSPPADSSGCQYEEETQENIPPNIYMYTEMRLEYPGNDAQLICRADGQPRPTVSWFDSDNSAIKNGDNFTVLANGDLLVKRINFGIREPFRQFSCQAANPLGKDVAVIDLLAISRSK